MKKVNRTFIPVHFLINHHSVHCLKAGIELFISALLAYIAASTLTLTSSRESSVCGLKNVYPGWFSLRKRNVECMAQNVNALVIQT
jgi:hypothetical protein